MIGLLNSCVGDEVMLCFVFCFCRSIFCKNLSGRTLALLVTKKNRKVFLKPFDKKKGELIGFLGLLRVLLIGIFLRK